MLHNLLHNFLIERDSNRAGAEKFIFKFQEERNIQRFVPVSRGESSPLLDTIRLYPFLFDFIRFLTKTKQDKFICILLHVEYGTTEDKLEAMLGPYFSGTNIDRRIYYTRLIKTIPLAIICAPLTINCSIWLLSLVPGKNVDTSV
jgi:hypothetical protein